MRVIALEEHFATPAFLDGPERRFKERAEQMGGRFATLVTSLLDIGDGRVAAMDAAGVDVQALSLTAPGVEQLAGEEAKTFARSTNDAIAEAVGATRRGCSASLRCRPAIRRRRSRSSSG